MAIQTISFLLAVFLGCQAQRMHITHAPPYVVLQKQDTALTSSDLHHVIGAPLGLSDKPSVLHSQSLLRRPKANVLISVASGDDLGLKGLAEYSLDMDSPGVNTELLMAAAQRRFLEPLMVDVASRGGVVSVSSSSPAIPSPSHAEIQDRLTDADSVVATLQTTLNHSLPSQGALLGEMQAVRDVVAQLQRLSPTTHPSTPDLLTFTLSGLEVMTSHHGQGSPEVSEGSRALTQFIKAITEDVRKAYKDHVMVEVVTHPAVPHSHSRKTRSLLQAEPTTTQKPDMSKKLNLEIDYYPDFPVTFNIVLWLMLILVLVVFFTAYGIWNMNPNLESILYRVPQDEMVKKNN